MPSLFPLAIASLLTASALSAAESPKPVAPAFSYADIADLALAAPVAAHVRVREAALVRGEQAGAVPATMARFYVQADLVGLIRGPEGLTRRVAYVVDLPRDAKARAPKLPKGTEFILLAAPVEGRPSELRLVAPDAQLPWSAGQADRVRAILREAVVPGAPPRITGIGRAFHVPGAVIGESETQIFLQAEDGRPVSLNVLRRPGQAPRWSVALSEVVDEAAASPARDSLLWYRLACTLPSALPPQSLAEATAAEAEAIRADYRVVMDGLGACPRQRPRR